MQRGLYSGGKMRETLRGIKIKDGTTMQMFRNSQGQGQIHGHGEGGQPKRLGAQEYRKVCGSVKVV